jgi:hypothetical protein
MLLIYESLSLSGLARILGTNIKFLVKLGKSGSEIREFFYASIRGSFYEENSCLQVGDTFFEGTECITTGDQDDH